MERSKEKATEVFRMIPSMNAASKQVESMIDSGTQTTGSDNVIRISRDGILQNVVNADGFGNREVDYRSCNLCPDDMGLAAVDETTQVEKPVIKKPLYYRFIKRVFDICFSACVIVVGFLPGLILSGFIMRDTGGSPIYSSERIGRGGKPFKVYKFRSMVADSDNLEKYFTPEQLELWHLEHKVEDDPRITKLGRFLRSSSIDEFPQFINVLLGQISVIGPRVITAEEVGYFGKDRDCLLSVPPGITGLWQTSERNKATFESGARQELELFYARNCSLKTDAEIFLKTFKTMIEGTGK